MKWVLSSPSRFYGTAVLGLALALLLAVGAASLRLASFEEEPVEAAPSVSEVTTRIAPGDAEAIRRLRPALEVAEEAYPEGTATVVAVEGPTSIVDVVTATETCSLVITRGEVEESTCIPH